MKVAKTLLARRSYALVRKEREGGGDYMTDANLPKSFNILFLFVGFKAAPYHNNACLVSLFIYSGDWGKVFGLVRRQSVILDNLIGKGRRDAESERKAG